MEGFYAGLDRQVLFERGDVYRVAFDEERAAQLPVRLAILGAGGVAQAKYLPAIARLRSMWEQVELVALSTLDPAQAQKLSSIWGVPAYGDSGQLLQDHRPDAVIVTSSDDAHKDLALAAIAAGAHVLVEKPIAPTLEGAAEITHAAEDADRILQTTCNKRFSPPYVEAHRLLMNASVPTPSLFTAKFTLGYSYVDLLASGTVHVFDLARFLMGDIRRLNAVAAHGSVETIAMTLEFESGAVGNISTTASALSLHPWERVEIFGDHAWLGIEDQSVLTLHPAEYEPTRVWAPTPPNTLQSAEEAGGYLGMLEAFLASIRGTRARPDPRDGYRALELVVATHLSARSGKPVDLPLTSS